MRITRSLFACAVVVGAFAAPMAMPSAAIASTAVTSTASIATTSASIAGATGIEADVPELVVTVVPESSGILIPGQDLTLTVTLENRTESTIAAGTTNVYLGRSVIRDRDALADWLEGTTTDDDDRLRGDLVAQVPSPSLFPGQSLVLPQVVAPAAALTRGDTTSFGAHRLSVVQESGAEALAESRSSITIDPGTGVPTDGLALAMPLSVPALSTGLVPADLLESYTAPTGLLSRQLDQAAGRPIAIGLDPRLLVSIRSLGTAAPESALLWLERLESLPNETFALAYADADLAATSQAGSGVPTPTPFPLDAALFPEVAASPSDAPTPTPSPEPSPTGVEEPEAPAVPSLETLLAFDYSLTGIAWADDIVSTDLDTFQVAGLDTTIVSSDNVAAEVAAAGAAVTAGTHSLVQSDAIVSQQFQAAVDAVTPAEWQSAMARLTASLATAALETGSTNRSRLATLGPDWTLGGFRLAQTLDAVLALPWSTPASLQAAIGQTPVTGSVVDTPVAEERLAPIREMFASDGAVAQFSSILADPTALTGPRRIALLSLLSRDWAADNPDWNTAVGDYLTRSAEIVSSVNVESSTITQWSDNGPLPITISNALDFPVTVYVTVQPRTAILEVRDSRVEVTIEANSQNRASVPVQSVANGQVVIAIGLGSATGVPISQLTLVEITVQAGWETAATAILGGILVIVFAIGIVRTVRRRSRLRRAGVAGVGASTDAGAARGSDDGKGVASSSGASSSDSSSTDDGGIDATPTRPISGTAGADDGGVTLA